MATSVLARRVQRDLRDIKQDPPEFVDSVAVDPANLTRVHFKVRGLPTPYEGGEYVVLVSLPPEYPMMPPDIMMMTPSGRFKTGARICTSFTSFHRDSWSPIYNFNTIMKSFLSFMLDETERTHVGSEPSAQRTPENCARFAAASAAYNEEKYGRLFAKNGTKLTPDAAAAGTSQ